MKLLNKTKNSVVIENLQVADSLSSRMVGLLKHHKLDSNEGLWIHNCPSIHTFFMKFNIDVVFIDANLFVLALYENVRPWRLVWPLKRVNSVVELSAGTIRHRQIELGDQLHVVH